jgi:hypothetical protein
VEDGFLGHVRFSHWMLAPGGQIQPTGSCPMFGHLRGGSTDEPTFGGWPDC